MTYSFQFLDSAGSASADGVFIPVASLPGIDASEFASSNPLAVRNAKALYALLNRCVNIIAPETFDKLGLNVVRNPLEGIEVDEAGGEDVFNQTFSFSYQKLVRLETNSIEQIPVPTAGANSGKGDFSILDVFPGASKVASGDALPGAGLLIPTSALIAYTSLTHSSLTVSATSDNREWFQALWNHLAIDASVRSSSTQSAVIDASVSPIGGTAIPASFTASTDPLSGIAASDRPRRGLITRTINWTVQCKLNHSSQKFDVYVA